MNTNICLYCKQKIIPSHIMGKWNHERNCEKKNLYELKKFFDQLKVINNI